MMGGAGAGAMRVEEEQLGDVAHSTPVPVLSMAAPSPIWLASSSSSRFLPSLAPLSQQLY